MVMFTFRRRLWGNTSQREEDGQMSNQPQLQQPLVQLARKITLKQAHLGSIQIIPTTGLLAWIATNFHHNQHGDQRNILSCDPTQHATIQDQPVHVDHVVVVFWVWWTTSKYWMSHHIGMMGKISSGTNVTKMRKELQSTNWKMPPPMPYMLSATSWWLNGYHWSYSHRVWTNPTVWNIKMT